MGEKGIRTEWPVEEGLTAGTQTQQGRESTLVPEEPTLLKQTNNWQELL